MTEIFVLLMALTARDGSDLGFWRAAKFTTMSACMAEANRLNAMNVGDPFSCVREEKKR